MVANFAFFLDLPQVDSEAVKLDVKGTQFLEPCSSSAAPAQAAARRLHQAVDPAYGDRLLIANATGCSSIYSGNLPTTPYTVNKEGAAACQQSFEDNAEFGFGMRLAVEKQAEQCGTPRSPGSTFPKPGSRPARPAQPDQAGIRISVSE